MHRVSDPYAPPLIDHTSPAAKIAPLARASRASVGRAVPAKWWPSTKHAAMSAMKPMPPPAKCR